MLDEDVVVAKSGRSVSTGRSAKILLKQLARRATLLERRGVSKQPTDEWIAKECGVHGPSPENFFA
jgi:hypothetical protein